MEPNRCYAITLDRFVNAKIEASASTDVPSDFVIETLDGPVAFFVHGRAAVRSRSISGSQNCDRDPCLHQVETSK